MKRAVALVHKISDKRFFLQFGMNLPATRIRRLVHDACLHDIRRRAHRCRHQTRTDRRHYVHHVAIGQAGFVHDKVFHRVVGRQVAQIHQRGALHVRHATLPQPKHTAAANYLAERVCRTVHARFQPHRSPFALHLHVHLHEIGGRSEPLGECTRPNAGQSRLPEGKRFLPIAQLLAEGVVRYDANATGRKEDKKVLFCVAAYYRTVRCRLFGSAVLPVHKMPV